MHNIVKYFNGEKAQCSIGLLVAIVFIFVSAYFLWQQQPLLKGVAYVTLLVSVLLGSICAGVVWRTPKDIARVGAFYQSAPEKMRNEELPRMEKVMSSFSMIKKVEIVLVLAGLLLFVFFGKNDLVRGIALGLLVQGSLAYLFDHLAEARGKIYVDFLKTYL
jgi:hypothetical protein